jgi:YHS domain-containing protein
MQKIRTTAIALSLALLAACAQRGAEQQQQAAGDTAAMAATPATAPMAGKLPDPVCGMDYDTSYHEWSVYKGDTVHFCSPTCKEVFDKNPEKWAAKLQ